MAKMMSDGGVCPWMDARISNWGQPPWLDILFFQYSTNHFPIFYFSGKLEITNKYIKQIPPKCDRFMKLLEVMLQLNHIVSCNI